MILQRWTFVLVIILVIALGRPANGECPEIDKLREFYKEKQFITLKFLQLTHSDIFETVDSLGGTLQAGREGRFRLTMPGQVLVSDGIQYWSYSVENEQVLVDSVAKLGDWNPLTLIYDPEKVYGCINQKAAEETLEFDMVALDSLTLPQQFLMRVYQTDYVPYQLVYYDDNGSRIEVYVKDFRHPSVLPDSLFEFHPGPEVEVIEMP